MAAALRDPPQANTALRIIKQHLNSIDENLNIQFANLTDNKSEYILKLFLDYTEIDYLLDGKIRNEYIFSANAGETFVFPVTLSNDIPFDSYHILTVAVLTAPEKHAYSIESTI